MLLPELEVAINEAARLIEHIVNWRPRLISQPNLPSGPPSPRIKVDRFFLAGSFPAYVYGSHAQPNLRYNDIDVWYGRSQYFHTQEQLDVMPVPEDVVSRETVRQDPFYRKFGICFETIKLLAGACATEAARKLALSKTFKTAHIVDLIESFNNYDEYNLVNCRGPMTLEKLLDSFDTNCVKVGVEVVLVGESYIVKKTILSDSFVNFLRTGVLECVTPESSESFWGFAGESDVRHTLRLLTKSQDLGLPFLQKDNFHESFTKGLFSSRWLPRIEKLKEDPGFSRYFDGLTVLSQNLYSTNTHTDMTLHKFSRLRGFVVDPKSRKRQKTDPGIPTKEDIDREFAPYAGEVVTEGFLEGSRNIKTEFDGVLYSAPEVKLQFLDEL